MASDDELIDLIYAALLGERLWQSFPTSLARGITHGGTRYLSQGFGARNALPCIAHSSMAATSRPSTAPCLEEFRQGYGPTKAELRVAQGLLRVQSLGEIAGNLGRVFRGLAKPAVDPVS